MNARELLGTTLTPALLFLGLLTPAAHGQQTPCGELAKLLPGSVGVGDLYGLSVSTSGTTLVAGAPGISSETGTAYVYERIGSSWVLQQELTPSDGSANDEFGFAVSMYAEFIIVGARFHGGTGAAYVFENLGGVWTEVDKLVPGDADPGDHFGWSVSCTGSRALIGAPGDDGAGAEAGAAYLYEIDSGEWTELAKLVGDDTVAGDNFGRAVAIRYLTAVVGAPFSDGVGLDSGAAYVFERPDDSWVWSAKLVGQTGFEQAQDWFGTSLATSGTRIVVGAPLRDVIIVDLGHQTDAGAAYVFEKSGTAWSPSNVLTAFVPLPSALFGDSVALSGKYLLVGAPAKSVGAGIPGAAYLFIKTAAAYIHQNQFFAADGGVTDAFGASVATGPLFTVVGATGDDTAGNNAGAVYVCSNSTPVYETETVVHGMLATQELAVGSLNGNALWFWDEDGLYRRRGASLEADEVTGPVGAIRDVRGAATGVDTTTGPLSATWFWTPSRLLRIADTGTAASEVLIGGTTSVGGLQGLVEAGDVASTGAATMWGWTKDSVYRQRHDLSSVPAGVRMDAVPHDVSGTIRGLVTAVDVASATGTTIWAWTDNQVMHTNVTQSVMQPVSFPSPPTAPIAGVVATPDNVLLGSSSIWVWTANEIYFSDDGALTTQMDSATLVPAMAGPIRGLVVGPDATSPSGSSIWAYGAGGVYFQKVGSLQFDRLKLMGDHEPYGDDVRGMVLSRAIGTPSGIAAWAWTDQAVFFHVYGSLWMEEVTALANAPIPGVRGMLISGEGCSSSPAGSGIFAWTDNAVYIQQPGALLMYEVVEAGSGASLSGVRGMAVTLDTTIPTCASIWTWGNSGVHRQQLGTTIANRFTYGSDPLVDTWAIIGAGNLYATSQSPVWIRGSRRLVETTIYGAPSEVLVHGGSHRTPALDGNQGHTAIVRNASGDPLTGADGGHGVGLTGGPSQVAVGHAGEALSGSCWTPGGGLSGTATTILGYSGYRLDNGVSGGVQMVHADGFSTSLSDDHSALLIAEAGLPFRSNAAALSIAHGGGVEFELEAGHAVGNDLYIVLGSLSGTQPGIGVDALTLALNLDFYFLYMLTVPNASPWIQTFGTLDHLGRATAALDLPPGIIGPQHAWLEFDHAYATVDPFSGLVKFVSNPLALELVP